jgi:hypothetical protein
MPDLDWQVVMAMRGVSDDLRTIADDDIDIEVHAAVDAVLLASRLCGRWRVAVACVWLAYRVGLLVGRLRG